MTRACNCIGPQNGDPVCPCAMGAYRQRKAEKALWDRVVGGKPRPDLDREKIRADINERYGNSLRYLAQSEKKDNT